MSTHRTLMQSHDPFSTEPIHISIIITGLCFTVNLGYFVFFMNWYGEVPCYTSVALMTLVSNTIGCLAFFTYLDVAARRIDELKRR